MPPIDWNSIPPEIAAWLQAQMGLAPDYRTYKGVQYQNAPDAGWMKDALNYKQDLLGSLMDPMIGMMAGDGAYDPSTVGMADVKAEAPVTAGTDQLTAIMQRSPGSWQAGVAAALLDGDTPDEAYARVSKDFAASMPKDPKTGEADPTAVLSFASDNWTKLLGDKAGTPEPTSWQKAGLYDPSMRFTPELMDPSLVNQYNPDGTLARQGKQEKASASRQSSTAANAQRDAESQRIAMERSLQAGKAKQASVSAERGGMQSTLPLVAMPKPGDFAWAPYGGVVDPRLGAVAPSGDALPTPDALKGGIYINPKALPVGEKDYGMTRNGAAAQKAAMQYAKDGQAAALAKIKATAGAADSRNVYGTPTMMQVAKRLGFLQG